MTFLGGYLFGNGSTIYMGKDNKCLLYAGFNLSLSIQGSSHYNKMAIASGWGM